MPTTTTTRPNRSAASRAKIADYDRARSRAKHRLVTTYRAEFESMVADELAKLRAAKSAG